MNRTVRRLALMTALAGLAAAPATKPAAESAATTAPSADVVEVKTITPPGDFYAAWATVARLRSGRLMVVYSGGRMDHLDPFGRIEAMTSDDDGKTWTWPRVLYDSPIDDRDAGLFETKDGTLLMPIWISTTYDIDLKDPLRRFKSMTQADRDAMFARWKQADSRTTDAEKAALRGPVDGRWLLRSTDGGLTWDKPTPFPGYNLTGPIEVKDGRLLYAGTDPKKPAVWQSSDGGATWSLLSVLPTRAGEMDMVEAADGRLIVHVRGNIKPDGKREQGTFQTESKDGGKTWTPVRQITDKGWPAQPIRLSDGRLLTLYGYRTAPFGVRGKISRDNGDTWGEEFVVYKDGFNWDLGYPTSVELPGNRVLTIWYETMEGEHHAVLRQAIWNLPAK